MKAIASKNLIDKIKPLLSDTPIMNSNVILDVNDCARIRVEFVLTKEIIAALASED